MIDTCKRCVVHVHIVLSSTRLLHQRSVGQRSRVRRVAFHAVMYATRRLRVAWCSTGGFVPESFNWNLREFQTEMCLFYNLSNDGSAQSPEEAGTGKKIHHVGYHCVVFGPHKLRYVL